MKIEMERAQPQSLQYLNAEPGQKRSIAVALGQHAIGPFFLVFTFVGLFSLLSYPLHLLFPNEIYDLVLRTVPHGVAVEFSAFLGTLLSFLFLILSYSRGPASKSVRAFQVRRFQPTPHAKLMLSWFLVSMVIMAFCGILYVQADYSFPLLSAGGLDREEYRVFRREVSAAVSSLLINLLLYFFLPFQFLIAFALTTRDKIFLRTLTVLLFGLTSLFLLARSSITVPIIVASMSYLALRPVKLRRLLVPVLAAAVLSAGMMAYSTKSVEGLGQDYITRLVHGQWVGLPLYLWYFEEKAPALEAYLHPALREYFGYSDEDTPGRELMRYVLPGAVEAGGAGNIPTYFIGEAYAIGGWWMVGISTLYISLIVAIVAWSFTRMPKTVFSCTFYGLICYKISSGLVSGLSAFLVSGTMGLVLAALCLAAWHRGNYGSPAIARGSSDSGR